MALNRIRYAVARGEQPWLRALRTVYRAGRNFSLPAPRLLVLPMLWLFLAARSAYYFLLRVVICEPFFKAYCTRYGRRLKTGVFIHWVQGQGNLTLGDDVVVDGKSSFIFAARYAPVPRLSIGDRSFIGHNCVFAIGKSIDIGRGCLLSTDVCVRDYDGHPTDPVDRAAGRHALSDEVQPIRIGDNVWVGVRAIILKGVTIGDNSVIGAAAVVTKDVPANCVVAGNPARVVKYFDSLSSPDRTVALGAPVGSS